MTEKFPTVTALAEPVPCFRCNEPLGPDVETGDAGYAPGSGQYVRGPCWKCGYKTYFDVVDPST